MDANKRAALTLPRIRASVEALKLLQALIGPEIENLTKNLGALEHEQWEHEPDAEFVEDMARYDLRATLDRLIACSIDSATASAT